MPTSSLWLKAFPTSDCYSARESVKGTLSRTGDQNCMNRSPPLIFHFNHCAYTMHEYSRYSSKQLVVPLFSNLCFNHFFVFTFLFFCMSGCCGCQTPKLNKRIRMKGAKMIAPPGKLKFERHEVKTCSSNTPSPERNKMCCRPTGGGGIFLEQP